MNKYTQDGVNVPVGDAFSAFAGQVCRGSYKNSEYVTVVDLSKGHFRGPRGYLLTGLPNYINTAAADGQGTKSIIIDAAGRHVDAGADIIAMTAEDISRWGGLALVIYNLLDTATLGKDTQSETYESFQRLMLGLGDSAKEQNIVLMGGETAELGVCVGSENPNALTKYNWAAFAIGVYDKHRMISGDTLKAGQVVIALRDYCRCNGFSSIRKALAMHYGEKWYENPDALYDVIEAAWPSKLYHRFLAAMNGWYERDFRPIVKMHLIVHVTGGSIRSKFAEDLLFPMGLSARLDSLWDPPDIIRKCRVWRGMSEEEAYETWNCGQGALVVVDPEDAGLFIELAARSNIAAKKAGEITNETLPSLIIVSKFTDTEIEFRPR